MEEKEKTYEEQEFERWWKINKLLLESGLSSEYIAFRAFLAGFEEGQKDMADYLQMTNRDGI